MTDKRRPSRKRNSLNPNPFTRQSSVAQQRAIQSRSPVRPDFPGQQSSLQQQHSPDLRSLGNSRSFDGEPSLKGQHSLYERHIPGHLQCSNEHPAGHLQRHTPNTLKYLDQHHSLHPSRLSKQEASGVSQVTKPLQRFTEHTSASHSLQQYSAVPWVLPPILYQKVTLLFEQLWLRPAEGAENRVIAVDGFDSQSVQAIVRYLDESIRRHTNLKVRVFGPLICSAGSDWFDYTKYIDQWDKLWKFLIETPFPLTTSAECFDQGDRSQSSTGFCVNIVPFSPLMITLRAGSTIHTDSETEELEYWSSLATDWWGKIRPDITINVFDANFITRDPGVVRIAGHYMNILAVAKLAWEADAVDGLTPEQLRRIEFEVFQWLIKWGAFAGAPQASKIGRE